jgi:hypothetical protein
VDAAGKISTPIIYTDFKVLVWFLDSELVGTGEVLVDSFSMIYQDKVIIEIELAQVPPSF